MMKGGRQTKLERKSYSSACSDTTRLITGIWILIQTHSSTGDIVASSPNTLTRTGDKKLRCAYICDNEYYSVNNPTLEISFTSVRSSVRFFTNPYLVIPALEKGKRNEEEKVPQKHRQNKRYYIWTRRVLRSAPLPKLRFEILCLVQSQM
jgi:hypothetical protein